MTTTRDLLCVRCRRRAAHAAKGGVTHSNFRLVARVMAGFVWYTNHRMWKIVPPFKDSWDVLKAYVVDASAYVYWSTPHLQDQIKVGDAAYIFRTVDKPGIVACGRVEETPRPLTPLERKRVRLSPRVSTPAGWDESVAPSAWKTGIRIERTFWDEPIDAGLRAQLTAVARLSEEDARAVEGEIGRR